MTTKRIITFAILFALLAVIGVQRVQMVRASTKPKTPIVFSVYENGQPLLAREYICNKIKISVIGPHTLKGDGQTWSTITADFRDQPNTRVFVEVMPLSQSSQNAPSRNPGRPDC